MESNFYSNIRPEYYKQKPHYDLGNKIIHSSVYKKLNPLRTRHEWSPDAVTELPQYFGQYPHMSWLYGSLDYSYNKYHRHYQSHDEWYPDRKNKSLGFKQGGHMDPTARIPKGMTFIHDHYPRGCVREIRKYHHCKENNPTGECHNQKISIMEVCPDHILDSMREKKKWYLRAKSIDNQTYRRAMSVSDYNKGRSVSDLQLKDWTFGKAEKLRPDSYWFDDRYDPTVVRHPHRYDTVNFPDKEYKDIFGGNWGQANLEEREKHALGFWSQKSKAMTEVDEKLAGGNTTEEKKE